jgi:hypothetical protein
MEIDTFFFIVSVAFMILIYNALTFFYFLARQTLRRKIAVVGEILIYDESLPPKQKQTVNHLLDRAFDLRMPYKLLWRAPTMPAAIFRERVKPSCSKTIYDELCFSYFCWLVFRNYWLMSPFVMTLFAVVFFNAAVITLLFKGKLFLLNKCAQKVYHTWHYYHEKILPCFQTIDPDNFPLQRGLKAGCW